MKILLFGGAFDPPHKGHISILRQAAAFTDFDKIIVMPTGTPTHKKVCTAPFDVRFHMAKAAFEGIEETVEVSDYEGKSTEADYTYLTLRHLKKEYNGAQIFMLLGSDSLINMKSWRNYEEILQNCTLLVFARQQGQEKQLSEAAQQLKAHGAQVQLIEGCITEASSSAWRNGQHNDDVLTPQVRQIIDQNHLYDEAETTRLIYTSRLLAKLMLDEGRYIHTLNVEKLALELGTIHGLDTGKLRIAALLHDILKPATKDILLHRAGQGGIINRIEEKPKQTLHGFAAADYAKRDMGIEDEEILWAIRSHTCGRYGMQDMEKAIYLADMLCEGRSFEGRDYLLQLAKKNLDAAMYEALIHSVNWIKSKGSTIDTDSLEAIKWFEELLNLGCKEE